MKNKRTSWKRLTLVAIVLIVGIFFSTDWLESRASALVQRILEKHQIHADYTVVSFSLSRGLKCKDIVLHRTSAHDDPVFSLSDLALKFSLGELIRNRFSNIYLTSRHAAFQAHHLEPAFEVHDLTLDWKVRPGHLTITDCTGLVDGLLIEASGELEFAQAGTAPLPPGSKATPKTPITELNLTLVEKLLPLLAIKSKSTPPVLRLHIERAAEGSIDVNGTLTGKAFTWRGVEIDSTDVTFGTVPDPGGGAKPRSVQFSSIQFSQGGGQLTGTAAYSPETRVVTIDKVKSSVDPFTLAALIRAKPVTKSNKIRFVKAPQLTASGSIPLQALEKAKLNGTIGAPAITVAMPQGSGLELSGLTSSFTHSEGVLKLPNLKAVIAGGTLEAPSQVTLLTKPTRFTTDLKLEGASFIELVKATSAHEFHADSGELFITFKGSGEPSLASLAGSGEARISNTDLVSVPILSNLAPLFTQIVTVFTGGTSGAGVVCDYQMNKGVFTSNDIRIKKSAFEISSTAKLNFPERQLYATGAVSTEGLTRLVTEPIGKVLELEASGSFDDYTWRFKNLPGFESIADIGKLIGGGAEKEVGALVKGAIGTVEADTRKSGKATGKAVKETVGELKKLIPGKK